MVATKVKLAVRDLTISYGGTPILRDVTLDIHEHEIFGIIGPANSGKTSFLRAINRMDVFTPAMRVEGSIEFGGRNVRDWRNVYALRRRIGVVFPLPVGLPMSVYDNVALAPRLAGIKRRADLDVIVERCLTRAAPATSACSCCSARSSSTARPPTCSSRHGTRKRPTISKGATGSLGPRRQTGAASATMRRADESRSGALAAW